MGSGGVQRFWKWSLKVSGALLDQGLVSGANFIVAVLLARWLQPADYGAFAIAYASMLIVSGAHNALLFEPLSVFGATTFGNWQRHYQNLVGVAYVILSLLVLAAGAVAATAAPQSGLRGAVLVGAVSVAPLTALTLVRRLSYLRAAPWLAARASLIYCTLALTLLGAFKRFGIVSYPRAFVCLAVASLAAAAYAWLRMPASHPSPDSSGAAPSLLAVVRRHWQYGRWVLISSVLTPFLSQWQLTVTAKCLGLGSAGVYRAVMNVTAPLAQGFVAISLLMLPRLARTAAERGPSRALISAGNVCGVMAGAAAVFEIILLIWHKEMRALLYANQMPFDSHLIVIAGFATLFLAAGSCAGQATKALNHPGRLLVAEMSAALVSIPLTLWLTTRFGLQGAIWSMVLAQSVWACAAVSIALLPCINAGARFRDWRECGPTLASS